MTDPPLPRSPHGRWEGPEAGWRSEPPSSSDPGSVSRLLVHYFVVPLSKGDGDEKLRTVNKILLLEQNRSISLIKV